MVPWGRRAECIPRTRHSPNRSRVSRLLWQLRHGDQDVPGEPAGVLLDRGWWSASSACPRTEGVSVAAPKRFHWRRNPYGSRYQRSRGVSLAVGILTDPATGGRWLLAPRCPYPIALPLFRTARFPCPPQLVWHAEAANSEESWPPSRSGGCRMAACFSVSNAPRSRP